MNAYASIAHVALCVFFLAGCAEEADSSGPEPVSTLFDAPAADAGGPVVVPELPGDAPTVVFVGDSIGAGLHLAEHQAFPAVLQRTLAAEGLPFQLVNASESGRTTAGGASALSWVLRSNPDVVVIELGGNDGLRGIELADIEKNLRSMIDTARTKGAEVLLLGVRLPANYGDYGVEFEAIYPRLAEELELSFVPSFMREVGGVPELNLPDGLHPTAEGQELLAHNVAPGLRQALQRVVER